MTKTKTIADVIELAIKGGWRDHDYTEEQHHEERAGKDFACDITHHVLDPLFWQAICFETKSYLDYKDCFIDGYELSKGDIQNIANTVARRNMHEMIDHIIYGGEVEDYLVGLIK